MKKRISVLLAVVLLLACVLTGIPQANAAQKATVKKTIGIVFDNSGSMYEDDNGQPITAWCRATYAMEVFASMLDPGDKLLIYPMHPITVDGKEYTSENPVEITDSAQASKIRQIYTIQPSNTPMASIDNAAERLTQESSASKKYLVVLTDGENFSEFGSASVSSQQLDLRINQLAGPSMTFMYLGIGAKACMPNMDDTEYFVKKKAVNTDDVLMSLTAMCNQIFGRDTVPAGRIKGNTVENIDISLDELIVFVQGENISGLKVTNKTTGQEVGTLVKTQQTKYAENACGYYQSVPDTSLQGMMVTYSDCEAGDYEIAYSGSESSIEVYYKPNADLDFVFTDDAGNTVDPNALYEGTYKVAFGMKDGRTGKLIQSDLLGNPHYEGSYFVNGQETTFTYDGQTGQEPVTLMMGDTFEANLTVTYLSGYTIRKDSTDFGWPEGGIKVAPRPAGDLRLEISGGQELYSLQHLEDEGAPYIAKVFYQGTQLTGEELAKVDLKWQPETSNAEIKKELADDHYNLWLCYKDPAAPQDTVCGACTVDIYAYYTAQGSDQAQGQAPLTYNIEDDFSPLKIELWAPQDYIVIKELEQSQEILVNLTIDGKKLSEENFDSVELQVSCGGINHTLTERRQDSAYAIKLQQTDGLAEGDYKIEVTGYYTDNIGRVTEVDENVVVTLSNLPMWVKWLIAFLILLILFIIIWTILHIRVLPKKAHTTKKMCNHIFDGENVNQATSFMAEIKKSGGVVSAKYGGRKFGLMMDVAPGQESYLYKSQKARSAEVKALSVRKFGPAKIQEALIGTAKYVMDDTTGKLVPAIPNQKPFPLKHGVTVRYSGTLLDAGIDKEFEVLTKISFTKK